MRKGIWLTLAALVLVIIVTRTSADNGNQPIPFTLTPVAPQSSHSIPNARNSCEAVQGSSFTVDLDPVLISGSTNVATGFFTNPDDPDLAACTSGKPSPFQGYRSAWYKFVAAESGRVTIRTVPSSDHEDDFDTILAVYDAGTTTEPLGCAEISVPFTCNDDANGLLSQVAFQVHRNETYFIEVVDRNLAVNGDALINLTITLDSTDLWDADLNDGTRNLSQPLSRHVAVPVGNRIYTFGGEIDVQDYPFQLDPDPAPAVRTAQSAVFDTGTQHWDYSLAPMPCGEGNLNGYSGTDGAYLANTHTIHIPSGFIGDVTSYSDEHCVYDIANNSWSTAASMTDPASWASGATMTETVGYAAVTAAGDGQRFYVTGGVRGQWFGAADGDVPIDGSLGAAKASDRSFCYDAATDTWGCLRQMSTPRYSHVAAHLTAQSGLCAGAGCICVAGGLNPVADNVSVFRVELVSTTECYSIGAGVWLVMDGQMNEHRFSAGSAVGPDGRWYVYGGSRNPSEPPVGVMEVYDINTDTWTVLDGVYDLLLPGLMWPRGGFIGNELWVVGGDVPRVSEYNDSDNLADLRFPIDATTLVRRVDMTEALDFPMNCPIGGCMSVFLPAAATFSLPPGDGNDTFLTATRLPPNFNMPGDFASLDDHYDTYYFEVNEPQLATIDLWNIPEGHNYALLLYDDAKNLLAASDNINNLDEQILIALEPGIYYVIVVADDKQPLNTHRYWIRYR